MFSDLLGCSVESRSEKQKVKATVVKEKTDKGVWTKGRAVKGVRSDQIPDTS